VPGRLDAELVEDQLAHGPACPEGRGDAQLLREVVVEESLDARGLLVVESGPGSRRPSGAVAGQGIDAAGLVGVPPARDGAVADAEDLGHLGVGVAEFTAADGAQAERLEDRFGQLAGVG
jgi:hypothetical protein